MEKKMAAKIELSSRMTRERSNENHEEKYWRQFPINDLLIAESNVKTIPVKKDTKPKTFRNETVDSIFFLIIN